MITEDNLQDIFELADILSASNREIYSHLKEIVFAADPEQILDQLERVLSAEAFDSFLDEIGESEKDNLWLILTYLLEVYAYAMACHQKIELDDFMTGFDRLASVRKAGVSLKLDREGLEPAAGLAAWAAVVEEKLADEGFHLLLLQTATGKNSLVFLQTLAYQRVQALAEKNGFQVIAAKEIS